MGPIYHMSPYKWKKEVTVREKLEYAVLLDLEMEEGDTSQATQAASNSGKRKETNPPLKCLDAAMLPP